MTHPTGPQLARRLRQAAADAGLPIGTFLKPLNPSGAAFVANLEQAASPRPATVDRIEALLAGKPIPPARAYRAPTTHYAARRRAAEPDTPAEDPPRVYRDPCPRCGTRADLGCKHQRPEDFL